jgi:cell division FtsZ-interacting protein ZapD
MDEKYGGAIDLQRLRLNQFLNSQLYKFHKSSESEIDFITRIYYAGCAAQMDRAKTSLDTWANQNDIDGNFYESMVDALTAAAIVEKT